MPGRATSIGPEQRQLASFLNQILVFLAIVAGLLTLVVAETWLREMLEVRTREWLTHDLLDQWLVPKRAYLLAFAGDIGRNPDQRLQADTLRLTELTIGLSIGLLRSSLLLVSFLGVLWYLSSEVIFVAGERSFTIPGYLVWWALTYGLSGSWLTWRVGKPLVAINAERYAREAELRFALVLGQSTLFPSIAGLWPWGTGTIDLPPRAGLMFVPQRPYLPLGALRVAICYPDAPESFDATAVCTALDRVGLGYLTPSLDREERWDKEPSLEEQQRLPLARLLLRKPRAGFLDEIPVALGGEQRALVHPVFERELAGTTVVAIGAAPVDDQFYDRVVQIVRTPAAPARRAPPHPGPIAAAVPSPSPDTVPQSPRPRSRRCNAGWIPTARRS